MGRVAKSPPGPILYAAPPQDAYRHFYRVKPLEVRCRQGHTLVCDPAPSVPRRLKRRLPISEIVFHFVPVLAPEQILLSRAVAIIDRAP
jgi:hypothetical protein